MMTRILAGSLFLTLALGPLAAQSGPGQERGSKLKLPKPDVRRHADQHPQCQSRKSHGQTTRTVPCTERDCAAVCEEDGDFERVQPVIGELDMVTDGDKSGAEGSFVELGPTRQWVQIDLGAARPLHAIVAWHYHSQARVYRDVIVQVSDDPAFKTGVTTVFNNDHDNSAKLGIGQDKEYIEVAEGKLFDPKGVKGRYVRLYSNGNTTNELTHYVEVEVFGSPK